MDNYQLFTYPIITRNWGDCLKFSFAWRWRQTFPLVVLGVEAKSNIQIQVFYVFEGKHNNARKMNVNTDFGIEGLVDIKTRRYLFTTTLKKGTITAFIPCNWQSVRQTLQGSKFDINFIWISPFIKCHLLLRSSKYPSLCISRPPDPFLREMVHIYRHITYM